MVASLRAENRELTIRMTRLEGLVENLVSCGSASLSTDCTIQDLQQVSSIEGLKVLKASVVSTSYRNTLVSLI